MILLRNVFPEPCYFSIFTKTGGLAVFMPLHKHDRGTFLAFITKPLLHLYEQCPIRGTWDCDKLL